MKPEETLEPTQLHQVIKADIVSEMQKSYLDYAMSVIVSRALPDVRDGLKPVHRRIIYAMYDQGNVAGSKFHKSAAVVGEVLKKYHPHGDSSVYEALVRFAQPFNMRYPLVEGQGNFGNVDGDPAAAMRYTEARLEKIAECLYADIDKETVNYFLNDLQNLEPEVLPTIMPNLLLNGTIGIAVGMATNMAPHNLKEVMSGVIATLDKHENLGTEIHEVKIPISYGEQTFKVLKTEFESSITVEELVEHIKGPDFPTGGIIYDKEEMIRMYSTGRGKVVTRAKIEIEETNKGKTQIIVKELPYQVNKASLIEKIADLVKNKKISGIDNIRDESDRRSGIRVVIEIKKGFAPKKIENSLYKYTQLQNNFNSNMVALVKGEPKLLNLKNLIEEFIKHRQEVIIRRTIYLLKRAKEREHILQGLKIALDNIDAIIQLIRSSKDAETAKAQLVSRFGLTEIQAQAILDMQLRRLSALERYKIEEELKNILNTIKEHEELLVSPVKIKDTIKEETKEIKAKYGDDRVTKVVIGKVGELEDTDIFENEKCIITISQSGYIKRLKEDTYRVQSRGGRGVKGQTLKDEDIIDTIRLAETHDWGLFFTNKGKVYKMRIWEIPEAQRAAKGTPVVNFLNISQEEKVQAFITIDSKQLEKGEGHLVFVTSKGSVKKTELKEFENIRANGIIAIKLNEDDSLAWVQQSTGKSNIILVTNSGLSIRFKEEEARPMGRAAAGVTGIKLRKKDDYLVGMAVVEKDSEDLSLLTLSEKGYGKRTPVSEYRTQGRGGTGVKTYNVSDKTGGVITARLTSTKDDTDVLIASNGGNIIRVKTKAVPKQGRDTIGVKLINLPKGDQVSSVAIISNEAEEQEDN